MPSSGNNTASASDPNQVLDCGHDSTKALLVPMVRGQLSPATACEAMHSKNIEQRPARNLDVFMNDSNAMSQ
jgi:hypothetical protein